MWWSCVGCQRLECLEGVNKGFDEWVVLTPRDGFEEVWELFTVGSVEGGFVEFGGGGVCDAVSEFNADDEDDEFFG